MPRVLEFGKYIIFFWMGEDGKPVHVHVSVKRPMDNSTKIWLTRNGGCLLAHNKGQIPPKDLRDIMDVVTFNHKLICDEWRKRFQGDISFYE